MNIFLNFYEIRVHIETDHQEIADRLNHDFNYFTEIENQRAKNDILIKIKYEEYNKNERVRGKLLCQREGIQTFEDSSYRYNIYNERLLSIYSFKEERGEIISQDTNLIHEVAYLLILSRVGKLLDQRGIHRIHAMATAYEDVEIIAIGASGVGKSTLCQKLLKQEHALISDDTPLFDGKKILPFPIRMGFENSEDLVDKNYITLNRRKFGKKYLIDPTQYHKIAQDKVRKKYFFLLNQGEQNSITRASLVQKIIFLTKYLLIGIGTPIIFEYFWESGFKDFLIKTKIFLKRLSAMTHLIFKREIYTLTVNKEFNAHENIIKFIKEETSSQYSPRADRI